MSPGLLVRHRLLSGMSVVGLLVRHRPLPGMAMTLLALHRWLPGMSEAHTAAAQAWSEQFWVASVAVLGVHRET
jgi:hypothetical protein